MHMTKTAREVGRKTFSKSKKLVKPKVITKQKCKSKIRMMNLILNTDLNPFSLQVIKFCNEFTKCGFIRIIYSVCMVEKQGQKNIFQGTLILTRKTCYFQINSTQFCTVGS